MQRNNNMMTNEQARQLIAKDPDNLEHIQAVGKTLRNECDEMVRELVGLWEKGPVLTVMVAAYLPTEAKERLLLFMLEMEVERRRACKAGEMGVSA